MGECGQALIKDLAHTPREQSRKLRRAKTVVLEAGSQDGGKQAMEYRLLTYQVAQRPLMT